jgi:hypothetical protein
VVDRYTEPNRKGSALIPVYAVFVVLGFAAVLGWIYLGLASSSVEGKQSLDPEAKFGAAGRGVVAGVLGFGLGGMSASFGGWGPGLAVLGAIGGGALMIAAARYLGVEDDPDEGRT